MKKEKQIKNGRSFRLHTIIIFLIVSVSGRTWADISVSFTPEFGFMYGSVNEYVLRESDGSVLSKLIWPFHPALYMGMTLSAAFNDMQIDAGFRTGIPINSGYIEDFDFLNNGSQQATHYSRHTASLETYLDTHIAAGYNFRIGSRYSLIPGIEFIWKKIQWSAIDGYLQYPSQSTPPYPGWTGKEPEIPVYGYGMNYQQLCWYPGLRIDFIMQTSAKTAFQASFRYAPYIFSRSFDNHFLRALQFFDEMGGGYGLAGALEFHIKAGTGEINIKAEYNYTGRLTGISATRALGDTQEKYTISRGVLGGTDSSVFCLSVAYQFSIL